MLDIALRSVVAIFSLWFLVVFLLLIHETGHLIALSYCKLKPDKIVLGNVKLFALNVGGIRHEFGLFPFFAFTISEEYARASFHKRAIVAVAGPLTSVLLAAGLYLCDSMSPGWYTKLAAGASLALGLWNLIPFPPMDGWPLLEWQLSKFGIVVSPKHRSILLAMGITTIAVLAVMSWN